MPLVMGGGYSDAEVMYRALRDNIGTAYSRDDTTRINRENRCTAFLLARAKRAQVRGALQALPWMATDALPDWEQRMQIVPGPSDMPHQRRAVLTGVLTSAGVPTEENIVAALQAALGETVSLVISTAPQRTFALAAGGLNPAVRAIASGGALNAGAHSVTYAFEDASGNIFLNGGTVSLSVAANGAILAGPVSLAWQTGAARVHWYLSVAANSTSVAYVASNIGQAVRLERYPSNPALPGLHHLAVVVSATTLADPVRTSRIHAVLGPMLSAWTTYDIVSGAPFLLDASPLDRTGL